MTRTETENAAVDDEGHFYRYFQVFKHKSKVVALENNSWSGTVPEIARRASAGGGHFSVCTGTSTVCSALPKLLTARWRHICWRATYRPTASLIRTSY